eukprot:m.124405 g.124405  ORF g.124405 m.124405 type:complete len:667 (+) comp16289_c0_seq1:83-2083(+)
MSKVCVKCNKAVERPVVVNAKTYHSECLTCEVCKKIITRSVYEMDSKFYCTEHYQERYGKRCAKCNESLTGKVIVALGKEYHEACFLCSECTKPIAGSGGFVIKGDAFVCADCSRAKNQCSSCGLAIAANALRDVQGLRLHADCVKCHTCKIQLSESTAQVFNKKLYCATHLEKAQNERVDQTQGCALCSRPITEQAVLALNKQWHRSCFVCHACKKPITSKFQEQDGKVYCFDDYKTLFGLSCFACGRDISTKYLVVNGQKYHIECAQCSICNFKFKSGEFMFMPSTTVRVHPHCVSCSTCKKSFTSTDECFMKSTSDGREAYCLNCKPASGDFRIIPQTLAFKSKGANQEAAPKPISAERQRELDMREFAKNMKLLAEIQIEEEAMRAGKYPLQNKARKVGTDVVWVAHQDLITGEVYYVNTKTGEPSLSRPDDFTGVVVDRDGNVLDEEASRRVLVDAEQVSRMKGLVGRMTNTAREEAAEPVSPLRSTTASSSSAAATAGSHSAGHLATRSISSGNTSGTVPLSPTSLKEAQRVPSVAEKSMLDSPTPVSQFPRSASSTAVLDGASAIDPAGAISSAVRDSSHSRLNLSFESTLDPATHRLDLNQLRDKIALGSAVSRLDAMRYEEYLREEDFVKALGMDKASFRSLPAWRKEQLKRAAQLI